MQLIEAAQVKEYTGSGAARVLCICWGSTAILDQFNQVKMLTHSFLHRQILAPQINLV